MAENIKENEIDEEIKSGSGDKEKREKEDISTKTDARTEEGNKASMEEDSKQTEDSKDETLENEPDSPDEDPGKEDADSNGQPEEESTSAGKKKKTKEQEKIEELTDRVKRQMAEFDNFRKRTDKEKSQMFEMGAANILEKLLPVVDNFERGINALKDEEKNAFSEGMEKIYKQLTTMLDDVGVEHIEAEGAEFDPELHDAVMHVDDDSLGENVVAEELLKGYKYKETVLRHSMVKVAN